MNINTGAVLKPQKVVIYGVEGIGKTTFAAQFPNPLFSDVEDSSLHMDVARFDKPTSWTMLLQQVDFVKQNRPCSTYIIDSIDWAEKLCKQHLIAQGKWTDSTNDYGAKYIALEKEFGELLNKLSDVKDAGMNVVLTAHAWLRKKEEPDEMGAYDRYELKLEKKTGPLAKEWADMVLFANYKTTILTDEKTKSKKGVGGQRMMFTTHRPAWDAKNRAGLADELPFDYSQIAHVIPNLNQQTKNQTPPVQQEPQQQPTQQNEFINQSQPEPQPDFSREPQQGINPAIPVDVADLMKLNQVTTDEIMKVIYVGGFMPEDTPVQNIPAELWGHLVTNWNNGVMNILNTQIRNF